MATTCKLCGEEIQTTFLNKLEGTVIKTGEGESSQKHYVCRACQKEHKEALKDRILEKS